MSTTLVLQACTLDLTARRGVRTDGKSIRLTEREASILACLATATGAVSTEALRDDVWRVQVLEPSAIPQAIRRLRTKIEAAPDTPDSLLTVHGFGYRLATKDGPQPLVSTPARAPQYDDLGGVWLDRDGLVLITSDGAESITPREAAMLTALCDVRRIDGWTSREEMAEAGWGRPMDARTLDKAIARLRKKLDRGAEGSSRIATARGEGYRLVRPGTGGSSALPTEPSSLFGREAELRAVLEGLEGSGPVTLRGLPGSGKTRIALRCAHLSTRGVTFVELGDARETEVAGLVAARVVGRTPLDPDVAVAKGLRLRGPHVLVLDGVDVGREPVRRLVRRLTEDAPLTRVLCTARAALEVPGERVVVVDPLPLEDARALLLHVVHARRPTFAPPQDELDSLAERLDRIPLAIELVGRQLWTAPLSDVSSGIARALGSASGGTLPVAVAASLSVLEPRDRQAVADLAVFEGSFDLAGAHAVLSVSDEDTRAMLSRLVEHSVLLLQETPAASRYRLPVIVRTALTTEGVGPVVRARHGTWFARARGDVFPAPEERADLAAATTWAVGTGRMVEAVRAVRAWTDILHASAVGDPTEALAWVGDAPPSEDLFHAVRRSAQTLDWLGRGREARIFHTRALEIARALGVPTLEAIARMTAALSPMSAQSTSDQAVREPLETTLAACAALVDPGHPEGATFEMMRGHALLNLRHLGDAAACLSDAADQARRHGRTLTEWIATMGLGFALEESGQPERAVAESVRAAAGLRACGAPTFAMMATRCAAWAEAALGDVPGATRRLEPIVDEARRTRALWLFPSFLGSLAQLRLEGGAYALALPLVDEALRTAAELGLPFTRAEALGLRANALVASGQREAGRQALVECEAQLTDALTDDDRASAWLWIASTRHALGEGDPAAALAEASGRLRDRAPRGRLGVRLRQVEQRLAAP